MARLSRECLITEKIDGTNASIYVTEDVDFKDPMLLVSMMLNDKPVGIYAGSRTRWITPNADNYGFAAWVTINAPELVKLGVGHHFGEWWGSGIQRGYGFKNGERFFSLFNAARWVEHDKPTYAIEDPNPKAKPKFTEHAPACCKVVPILDRYLFGDNYGNVPVANEALRILKKYGSRVAPNYMNPEGIVVYHIAGNVGFKKTIEKDEMPKGIS